MMGLHFSAFVIPVYNNTSHVTILQVNPSDKFGQTM